MTFKQLAIGAAFEFTSVDRFPFSGMARGPWVKVSARRYTLDRVERDRHQENVGFYNEVGSNNVEVKSL